MHLCEISDDPGWEPKCKRPASHCVKLTDHKGFTMLVWLCDLHFQKEMQCSYFAETWEHVEY